MVKEFPEKITVYITVEQKKRVQALPKSFNLTEKMREALDKILDKYEKLKGDWMKFVVHCRKAKYDVYIGGKTPRYNMPESKWHNPFKIDRDGTREEVIEKYRQYLLSNPALMACLPELKGKVLGCWCSPKACHGDVLVELANKGDWNDKNNNQHALQWRWVQLCTADPGTRWIPASDAR